MVVAGEMLEDGGDDRMERFLSRGVGRQTERFPFKHC